MSAIDAINKAKALNSLIKYINEFKYSEPFNGLERLFLYIKTNNTCTADKRAASPKIFGIDPKSIVRYALA